MQKKKKIYIAILIISTLILIADIAVFFITKPSMGGFGGRGEMPSFSGEMPEGFENFGGFGGFGGFSGEMPEGFDPSQLPEGFENFGGFGGFGGGRGEMPSGNMPGNMPGGSKLRVICIPIAIVCVVVDIICAIGLFRLNKKNGKVKAAPQKAEIEGPIDPVAARLAKKKRQHNVGIVVLALVLVGVLVLQILSNGANQAASSLKIQEEVITAQVETGNIQKYLNSGGVLASVEDVEVTVPGNVTLTKYLVASGDNVSAGEAIAVVDKNSVMAAIADLQEMMDELDEEITEAMDESIDSRIKASVDGTVVIVYAEDGETVIDVMYDHGALALISLDGLLALELEHAGGYTVGDTLLVVDKDGNKHDGSVAAIGKDTLEVTVSLDDFSFEEEVTVTDSEGTELGKGKLYIYSQQKITGYSGTVADVLISEGDEVSVGENLVKLSDTDYTAAYQVLLSKRLVLEDQYNELVEIGNTGYLYAKTDGMISGLDSTVPVEKKTASSEAVVEEMSVQSYAAKLMKLSTIPEDTPEVEQPEVEPDVQPDVTETVSKSVNIVWMNSDGSILTEGMPEKVTVMLVANGVLKEKVDIIVQEDWSYTWSELPKYENGAEIKYEILGDGTLIGYKEATQVKESVTLMMLTKEAAVQPGTPDTPSGDQPGTDVPGGDTPGGNMPSGGQTGGTTGGTTGGFPSGGMTGNFSSGMMNEIIVEENTYVFQELVVAYLSPNDQVDVEITIDELDINRIKVGEACEVTLDAFVGQSFDAVVTGINKDGENSGGNTKYTVTVSMEKQADMLLGMNASVKIPMQSVENVLMIPEEALIEKGNAVYVYTEYSERSDELGGLVEVTTGLSDGENVEILSGLESEQNYYYRYADTITYSFL